MPTILPDRELAESSSRGGEFVTVIFNNDVNSMEEVMFTLMDATGCDAEEAYIETWEAHTYGKANVHFAHEVECIRVAAIIESIGVKTEVKKEWE